jgi:hypothetical protein
VDERSVSGCGCCQVESNVVACVLSSQHNGDTTRSTLLPGYANVLKCEFWANCQSAGCGVGQQGQSVLEYAVKSGGRAAQRIQPKREP